MLSVCLSLSRISEKVKADFFELGVRMIRPASRKN